MNFCRLDYPTSTHFCSNRGEYNYAVTKSAEFTAYILKSGNQSINQFSFNC